MDDKSLQRTASCPNHSYRAWRLAPSSVEKGIGSGDARGVRCFSRAHNANEGIDRRPGMAACERANFDDSFRHICFWHGRGDREYLTTG